MAARFPRTGRSHIRWPCLERSSSTKPIGLSPSAGWAISSLTIISPAAPAPTMSARGASSSRCCCPRRPNARTAKRGAAANAAVSRASMKSTLSGTRMTVRPSTGRKNAPITSPARPDAVDAEMRRSMSIMPA